MNVLVSNAGIALDGFDDDVVARTLATNYFGATGRKHREIRDLDLFFHHETTLGSLVANATHALQVSA